VPRLPRSSPWERPSSTSSCPRLTEALVAAAANAGAVTAGRLTIRQKSAGFDIRTPKPFDGNPEQVLWLETVDWAAL
jgi:hypothetical protein